MGFLERLSRSSIVKTALTLIVYAFYAAVLGACFAPSVLLVVWAFSRYLLPILTDSGAAAAVQAAQVVLFSLFLGAAAFLFYAFGLLVMGSLIRLFSLGVKPGRHEAASLTVLLWIILNGVWTMAFRLILPMVPMTPLSQMFHRVSGCRIGKNVWINTISLIDCYMISIGDNTIVGGDAVLSPHVFENGHLIIQRITIGKNCLIGGHSYISPGVTIGDGSVIGMKAYIRKGKQIPPGTKMTSVAGLPYSRALDLERGTYGRLRSVMK
jgi:carbonic anhydrase/acetyltransferase-like protein (isoleucine patch superfamily)